MQNTQAKTPKQYIEALEEPRKEEIAQLDKLIRKTVPSLKPYIQSGMLAYGPYRYKYASGREGDWAWVALASQKNYISLYVACITDKGYLAESYKNRLPKANVGKSCVRFKRVGDVDLEVITEMLKEAEKLYLVNQ